MENEKSIMSNEESLRIIRSMIESTKQDLRDNGSWFLLWGWLVFIACVLHYVLMEVGYEKPYQAWSLMILGGVISIIKGFREEKSQKVKTHIDEFMKYVLVAFLVSLFIVLGFMSKLGLNTYPLIMMVYGFWLFISGGVINFRPLQIGGIINWILAITAFFVGFELQLLILGIAVLLGYIIPGYILRNRYNKASKLSPNNAKESYV
jgi:hypothetical protein